MLEMMHRLLLEHQKSALIWLLDQHTRHSGSILADEMGLGKTITTIALLYCLHVTIKKRGQNVGPTLIVCPATLIRQWQEELQTWALVTSGAPGVFEITAQTKGKSKVIQQCAKEDGVLLVSYDTLRVDQVF